MKKYVKCTLCIVLIVITTTVTAYAAEGTGESDGTIFGTLNEVNAKGSYLEYRDNYYLDMEDVSLLSSPGAVIFNMAANGVFGLSKNIGCLTAVATRFAMSTDIYDLVSEFISPFFKSMRKIVFDSLATYFIAAAAFYFMLQLLRSRHSQVIGGLIAVMLIVAAGLFYYAQPMFILSTLNNVTTELSSTVMDAPYDALTDEKVETATAGDKSVILVWNVMVHSQWQYLEFGNIKKAATHEKEILTKEQDSDERTDYIEEIEQKGLMKGNTVSQIERLGLSLIFLVFNILLLIIILGFSVLILGYQFFVLFLAILGTFVFVLALIPNYGTGVLKRWAGKLLTSSAVKIILVFFLAILFIIMDFLYSATSKFGLLPTLFMMISMCIIVAVKRKDIAELFLGTSGGRVIKGAGDIAAGAYEMSGMSGLKDKLSDLRRGQEQEMEDEDDDERRAREERMNRSANDYLSEAELKRQYQEQMIAEQGDGIVPNVYSDLHAPANTQASGTTATTTQNLTGEDDTKNLHGENITNEDYRNAEEILSRNYALSKEKAENLAETTGEPVQYSDFVQRTDAVRDLGSARFDDRDILRTARILKRTEAAGGSMEDLIGDPQDRNSGERPEEIRPQSCMTYMAEEPANAEAGSGMRHESIPLDQGTVIRESGRTSEYASDQETAQAGIHGQEQPEVILSTRAASEAPVERTRKGLNFFRENFGEEKGEKYYEKMCAKYGEEAVSQFSTEGENVSYSQVNQSLRSSFDSSDK